jgi:multidrug efflux pump subunit AcrA (membrane-fusion protein)
MCMQRVSRHLGRRRAPGILAVVAIAAGAWLLVRERAQASVRHSGPIEQTARVMQVTATGVVEPIDPVAIAAPVGGRVARVLVDEGARVKAGALLATIEGPRATHVDVRAPVAGTIVRRTIARDIDVGADAPMFTLGRNVSGVRIVVAVPAADVGAVTAPTITVSAPVWPDRLFEAKLVDTPTRAHGETTYAATVEVLDPGHVLPVGTSASVTFTTVVRDDVPR